MTHQSIEQISFLRRVVVDNPLQAALKNIYINNRNVQVSNGKITAGILSVQEGDGSSRFDGIQTLVLAKKFIQAYCIELADENEDTPILSFNKMLIVKSGRLQVRFQPDPQDISSFPSVDTEDLLEHFANEIKVENSDVIKMIKTLRPFVGEAGKTAVWSCGILLDGKYAYATNNVILIRYEFPVSNLPKPIIIPIFTMDTLLGVGKTPKLLASDGRQVFFVFDDPTGAWIQSPLIDEQWPMETVEKIISPAVDFKEKFEAEKELEQQKNKQEEKSKQKGVVKLDDDFKKIAQFCEDETQALNFDVNKVSTKEGTVTAEISYEDVDMGQGAYRANKLAPVLKIAESIDLTQSPAPFVGEKFIGICIGLKK